MKLSWLLPLSAVSTNVLLLGSIGFAQTSISPAGETNFNTQVNFDPQTNTYDILGGATTGQNLFHSFEQFNLEAGEAGNFLTEAGIRNVLGRVVGNDPSRLNGTLGVTGSDANLYLMNPSGIIFGQDFQLNVPADFTATTSTAIAFDGDQWFNAYGPNDVTNLLGDPIALEFAGAEAGNIVNLGDIVGKPGAKIALIGNQVVDAGSITVPDGTITIAAVPDSNLVKISQQGSLLSLEFKPLQNDRGQILPIKATDIPGLLTGLPDDRGLISKIDLNVTESYALATGELTAPEINIVGQQVELKGATLNADGVNGGGNIRVGGELQGQTGLPTALNTYIDQDSKLTASAIASGNGGRIITWADGRTTMLGEISVQGGSNGGDGGFVEVSGKQFLDLSTGWAKRINVAAPMGQSGKLLLDPTDVTIFDSTSPFSPIGSSPITASSIADEDINDFLNLSGSLEIRTDGIESGELGDIILDPTALITWSSVNNNSLTLVANNDIVLEGAIDYTGFGSTNPVLVSLQANQNIFSLGNISGSNGSVEYIATNGEVDLQSVVNTGGGNLTVTANGLITGGGIINTSTGNATFTSQNGAIDLQNTINTGGGSIVANANNALTVTGNLNPSGGPITLTSTGANVDTSAIALNSGGGNIAINGNTGILANDIDTGGGALSLISTNGAISTQDLITSPLLSGNGGNLAVNAGTTISTGNIATGIDPFSLGNGGAVNLTGNGNITVGYIDAQGDSDTGIGGTVTINTGTTTGNHFTATASFPDNQGISSSIATIGGGGGGAITITHGGNGAVDFIVGNAAVNGTQGALNTGTSTISPTQAFNQSFTQGNIQIITNAPTTTDDEDPTDQSDDDEDGDYGEDEDYGDYDDDGGDNFFEDDYEDIDDDMAGDFEDYAGLEADGVTLEESQQILSDIERNTGVKPGLLYIRFSPTTVNEPESLSAGLNNGDDLVSLKTDRKQNKSDIFATEYEDQNVLIARQSLNSDQTQWQSNNYGLSDREPFLNSQIQRSVNDKLELVLVTAEGDPIRQRVDVTRGQVLRLADRYREGITNLRQPQAFMGPSQQLYSLLIEPIEAAIQEKGLTNITFLMNAGLRSLPMAALYDGEQFLVEKYSVGLMPSISLSDNRYVDVKNMKVLAMGAETFADQNPLPAVPIELDTITNRLWTGGTKLLNQDFNLANLNGARENTPFGILHLATHGEFKAGNPSNSYIQFGNEKVTLDQLPALSLNDPPIELMVLSACRTALGDEEAELGFAGLAVMAGVKSAMGSLWYVSDEGTLALMSNFYNNLLTAPIKAEALRNAQQQMINGTTKLVDGQLMTSSGIIPLPDSLSQLSDRTFSHPYYWSAFTMIGNPW